MADIEITVDGGTSKRLLTAGKYCDKNILVTATGGGEPEPPDDGKTRLYITVPANAMPDRPPPRNQVPLYIQQTVANGVTIDWGDGTAPETLPGNKNLRIDNGIGPVNTIHTYKNAGDYIITLDPKDECKLGFGDFVYSRGIIDNHHIMGDMYIPNMYLKKICIGRNVNDISMHAFASAILLTSVTIPDGVSKISEQAFNSCFCVMTIVVSRSVSTIGDRAFFGCYAKEYHFFSEIPPILETTNVFQDIPSDCIIYVPKGSAEAYKTATNWTTVADKIQEEP